MNVHVKTNGIADGHPVRTLVKRRVRAALSRARSAVAAVHARIGRVAAPGGRTILQCHLLVETAPTGRIEVKHRSHSARDAVDRAVLLLARELRNAERQRELAAAAS